MSVAFFSDEPKFRKSVASPLILPSGTQGEAARGSAPTLAGVGPKKMQKA